MTVRLPLKENKALAEKAIAIKAVPVMYLNIPFHSFFSVHEISKVNIAGRENVPQRSRLLPVCILTFKWDLLMRRHSPS